MKSLIGILAVIAFAGMARATTPPRVLIVPAPPPEDTSPKRDYPKAEITFSNRGTLVAKMTVAQMAARVKPVELPVLDPYSLTDEVYSGLPLEALFYAVYESAWRKADNEVIFKLANGTQVYLPGAKIIRSASYLVFERKGSPTFAILNEKNGGKPMDLGPFYLAWDNFREPNLKDLGSRDWFANIVSVDLANFADRYPRTIPPARSSPSVKRGFEAFRRHCAICHTMNGDGSSNSNDLNYPTSVTEYLSEKWLRKWIVDPKSIVFNTIMPPLDKRDPTYKQSLEDILSYLKAMARTKRTPIVRTGTKP